MVGKALYSSHPNFFPGCPNVFSQGHAYETSSCVIPISFRCLSTSVNQAAVVFVIQKVDKEMVGQFLFTEP